MQRPAPDSAWKSLAHAPQQGGGLVGILVALGILGILAAIITQGLGGLATSSQAVANGNAFAQVDDVVRSAAFNKLSLFTTNAISPHPSSQIVGSCAASQAAFKSLWSGVTYGGVALGLVDAGHPAASEFGAAKTRCDTRQTFATGGSRAATSGIYFCLTAAPTATTPANHFVRRFKVLVEATFVLKRLSTGAAVTCATYVGLPALEQAATLYYKIYWVKNAGPDRRLSSFAGVIGGATAFVK